MFEGATLSSTVTLTEDDELMISPEFAPTRPPAVTPKNPAAFKVPLAVTLLMVPSLTSATAPTVAV